LKTKPVPPDNWRSAFRPQVGQVAVRLLFIVG
jgi:hypothetical protein